MLLRFCFVLITLAAAGAAPAYAQPPAPDRFEKDIVAFEERDRTSPPPKGEIVFVGSSTIRLWDTAAAFPDLKIINRGFGGSWLAEATRYADRIIIPYEPRLIVLYAGDNDIAQAYMSEQLAFEFQKFVRAIHSTLPRTRILYIGIKPSILRWLDDERFDKANDMIREMCAKDDRLAFIDFGGLMLGWDEKPRPELFVSDGLHMTPAGYAIWNAAIRPFLLPPAAPAAPVAPTRPATSSK
jgi:lysophospholipase L1-like esterase